jgi:hypothetical protein
MLLKAICLVLPLLAMQALQHVANARFCRDSRRLFTCNVRKVLAGLVFRKQSFADPTQLIPSFSKSCKRLMVRTTTSGKTSLLTCRSKFANFCSLMRLKVYKLAHVLCR